jgi:hypothetical protein
VGNAPRRPGSQAGQAYQTSRNGSGGLGRRFLAHIKHALYFSSLIRKGVVSSILRPVSPETIVRRCYCSPPAHRPIARVLQVPSARVMSRGEIDPEALMTSRRPLLRRRGAGTLRRLQCLE